MKLPAHMSIALTAYIRSDALDANAAVKVGGCIDTDFFNDLTPKLEEFTKVACDSINEAMDVTDARPMTCDEVLAYQAELQEEQREHGYISESMRVDGSDDILSGHEV